MTVSGLTISLTNEALEILTLVQLARATSGIVHAERPAAVLDKTY